MKKLFVSLVSLMLVFTFSKAADGYKPGDKARDFKLKNIDGKMIGLADYKDAKGFIVVFTCNHCPFAQAYESRIIALDKQYKGKGFPVIAINPNDKEREPADSYENMIARAKEKNYSFPYLYDESQEIAKAYGATRTPHVYVVSKKGGDLTVEYIGAIDNNTDDPSAVTKRYVEDAVNSLLAGKKPDNTFTKAIGCTIKWKGTE